MSTATQEGAPSAGTPSQQNRDYSRPKANAFTDKELESLRRGRQRWEPEEGDLLVGELVDVESRDSAYDEAKSYTVLVVENDDGKHDWSAGSASARRQLDRWSPRVGEWVAIVRHADSPTDKGNPAKNFELKVAGRGPQPAASPPPPLDPAQVAPAFSDGVPIPAEPATEDVPPF